MRTQAQTPSLARVLASVAGFLAVAVGLALAAAALADSKDVGAYTFGAFLLVGWLAWTLSTAIRFQDPLGRRVRIDPLSVIGVSLMIVGTTIDLANRGVVGWIVWALGGVLTLLGWRRSDLPKGYVAPTAVRKSRAWRHRLS
jgi:hypothetical protein